MDSNNGQNGHAEAHDEQGGQGATILTDPHHVREDLRLTSLAIRKGWVSERRWNTDVTPAELQKRMEESNGQLTLKERTLLAVMNGVTNPDPRVSGIAAKNVIAMEGQNLAGELKQVPDLHVNIHRLAEDEKRDRLSELLEKAKGRKSEASAGSNGTPAVQAG